MAQLLAALAIIGVIAYFAFFSHSSKPTQSYTSTEMEQVREAQQPGGTAEMQKAKQVEQTIMQSADEQHKKIDDQSAQ